MRPPSKHGLERKFKPWRKGESKKTKRVGSGDNGDEHVNKKRAPSTNASLKNQLRGQKRLLAKKLQHQTQNSNNGDGHKDGGEDKDAMIIDDVQQRIVQLEKDIVSYEVREREKKNAAK